MSETATCGGKIMLALHVNEQFLLSIYFAYVLSWISNHKMSLVMHLELCIGNISEL